jgi:hypothetical protein
MRSAVVLLAAAIAVLSLASGCGGSPNHVALSLRITSGYGSSAKDLRFTLRCFPTGGDMPNRAALCRMISEHPKAMLDPGPMRSTCVGGLGLPSAEVKGKWHGRNVHFDARPNCDWPGGEAALAYWSAAEMPHSLPVASNRLRCDDNPELQKDPIPWSRVRACLRKLPPHWRPSTP